MQVEMIHNPYQGSLQILVNGQARQRLANYAYKPFSAWYKDVFNILDGETNEPYTMILTADNAESTVIQALSKNTKYCKNVSLKRFHVNISLEDRISNLEQVYRNRQNLPIQFCIMPSLKSNITSSDVQRFCTSRMFSNNLWSIQCNFCDVSQISDNSASCEYLYIIAGNEGELHQQMLASARKGYYSEIYCIVLDGKSDMNYIGSYLAMHSAAGGWQTALHQLMKCTVIGDCFSTIYNNLPEQSKGISAFQIKERPRVTLPKFVEKGSQVDILVTAMGEIPELDISVRNPSILAVSGRTLFGVGEGITNVQVFEKGTSQPLASADVQVKFIPRIRELYPNDVALRHGEVLSLDVGRSVLIPYSYGPKNSENVKNIRWHSDNTAIVKVDAMNGRITARRSGHCTISCDADGVGFSVRVEVIPAPEKIELLDLYGSEIVLNTGDCYELKTTVIPANAHYGNISFQIMNTNVIQEVNGKTIRAVGAGETKIVLCEDLHGVSTSVVVRVFEVKKQSFLSRLFNR